MKKIILFASVFMIIFCGNLLNAQTVASPGEPYAFLYEKVVNENTGEEIVVRTAYPYSVKQQKDEEAIQKKVEELQGKRMAAQQGQNFDARSVAAWLHFNDQLELWQEYIGKTVLRRKLGTEDTAMSDETMMTAANGGEMGAITTQQTTSLGVTSSQAGFKTTKEIDWTSKESLESSLQSVFESMQTLGTQVSEQQKTEVSKIADDLDSRADKRLAYKAWLEEIKAELDKYAVDWENKSKGKVVTLDGNNYLISDKPVTALPRGHHNVVSPSGFLSPYDFLNTDGSFKKPAE